MDNPDAVSLLRDVDLDCHRRMTYLRPQSIVPLMDAITDGWQLGRTVDNIQAERWEEMLDQPLAEVRAGYGIHPDGRAPLATAHAERSGRLR